MAIRDYSRDEFASKLNGLVSASQPVNSIEQLFGRESELDRIERALYAPGRHIFVYGDRGVGKSSLAATAANQYQSADAAYIDVSCSPDATLKSIVKNVAYQSARISRLTSGESYANTTIDFRYFKIERGARVTVTNLDDQIHTLTDAVEILREVAALHSERPIVVLDEFDRIQSLEERSLFADLVKHLGDKRIPIKFIFTGVAKTLDELLGAHQSAIRQFETIELPRLGWEARWEIVLHAMRAFGVQIDREIYIRIAAVSDGYPYYVHLVTEKLLWQVFLDPAEVSAVTTEHFRAAIWDAINSTSAELKRPYEAAVNQRAGDLEEVLWATADSEYLHRYLQDMYSSYQHLMRQVDGRVPLEYEKFAVRIRGLKSKAAGEILIPEGRKGLYSYRLKMLRGYVRMQAEAHGVRLLGEEAKSTEKQYMHVSARVSTGYHQSTIPRGVHFGRRRGSNEKGK